MIKLYTLKIFELISLFMKVHNFFYIGNRRIIVYKIKNKLNNYLNSKLILNNITNI